MSILRNLDEFPVLLCSDCTFMQVGRVLPDEAIEAYYQDGYGGLRQRQGQEVNSVVNFSMLKKSGILSKGSRLLDVGCGYGFLLHRAQLHGAEVVGVELADSEVQFARQTLGVDVRCSLSDVAGKFDIVCLFEVVEHVPSPVDFMQEVASRVRPGGYLCVSTDNFESSVVRRMGGRFPKWIPHQHISLFSSKTIQDLFETLDEFEVVFKRSYTPWELLLQKLIVILSGGSRGGREFRLHEEATSENARPYRLFSVRRSMNAVWARLSSTGKLSGEMMFIFARRRGNSLV